MAWSDEQVGRVHEARVTLRAARITEAERKANYKAAIEERKKREAELTRVLDEELDGQGRLPLLDGAEDDRPIPAEHAEAKARDAALNADDEAWKKTSLAAVGLKPKHLEALNAIDLFTVGQFADWSNRGGVLESLPGIGPAAAQTISDAFVAHHQRWRAERAKQEAERLAKEAPEVPFDPPRDWTPEADKDDG